MAGRNYRPEQTINKIRKEGLLPSLGSSAGKATRKIGVVEQTHCADGKNTGG